MGFRSVEIANPAEVHIKNGQMHVEQEQGSVWIPLENIATINCLGANIRFSTMGLNKISKYGITIQCINQNYKSQALVVPNVNNVRQTLVIHKQIMLSAVKKNKVWQRIVSAKIENQARALSILGTGGADKVMKYSTEVLEGDVSNREAIAAKEYFEHYHKGLNRKTSDPINSCLNYGYAVLSLTVL